MTHERIETRRLLRLRDACVGSLLYGETGSYDPTPAGDIAHIKETLDHAHAELDRINAVRPPGCFTSIYGLIVNKSKQENANDLQR
jgi:hypothetical protein